MTQEEKQLLLKDLCARLPYGVKVRISSENDVYTTILDVDNLHKYILDGGYYFHGLFYKIPCFQLLPYLRPMSSMTEKEKDELYKLCDFKKSYDDGDYFSHYGIEIISEYCVNDEKIVESTINYSVIDFFSEHHLDYRGLIPMGLALKAPTDMYKTE